MKKLNLTLVLVLISVVSFAGIYTVDNHLGSGANFTSISAAVSSATTGDTIYIHPSSVSYGNVNLGKTLVFIGPGHHPEYTGGTGASIGVLKLFSGSSGSKFTGLIFKSIQCVINNSSHNIDIRNNFFYGNSIIVGQGTLTNSWLVLGNVIIEEPGCGGCALINVKNNSNWIISNNFIQTKLNNGGNTYLFDNLNSTTIVENNIIVHQNTGPLFYTTTSGGEFRNNIFWVTQNAVVDIMINADGVVFTNNITYHSNGSLVPLTGDNNIDNSNPEFVAIAAGNPVWDYLNNYQLSPGSPGENAGVDGTDMGVYGGGFPFRTEGYPQDFPRLQSFDILSNTIVPPGGSIEINLKATKAGL